MHREIAPAVYLLASRRNGTLYTGVTSDLVTRVAKHRAGTIPGISFRDPIHIRYTWPLYESE